MTYAREQADKSRALPKFILQADAFDMSEIAGKHIFNIPISSDNPFQAGVDSEAKKVAERYGATWTEYRNEGRPNQWTAGVSQAISQRVDLLMLSGPAVELLAPVLRRAKAAGIKILVTQTYPVGGKAAGAHGRLIDGYRNAPFGQAGRLEVDYAIADSEGKANALIITSNDFSPSRGIVREMRDEFGQHCQRCRVEVANVATTEWSTKIASTVQSAMIKNPRIDYIIPLYDSMSLFAQSGVRASGKSSGEVKIISYNGSPPILKLIQDGNDVAMDVGESTSWLGWANMDQAGRLLTNGPVVSGGDEKTPLRVFDDTNIDEAGTPPSIDKGYGDAHVAGYQKLWGSPK